MTQTFTLHTTDKNARTGTLVTPHGAIRTPAFMPVGTAATVKAMKPEDVAKTGADIVLGNTYHLMLRPTAERIARLGGLHKFMNWNKPILTDSGGFQVMSLSKLRKLTEQSVIFQSHIDGNTVELSPERSIEIQHLLGSDITMVLDECTPFPATHEQAKISMELSMRWAQRSKEAFTALKLPPTQPSPSRGEGYLLFGIVQGSIYPDLREISARGLQAIGFDGYAIGGLAVGEGQELMFRVLNDTMPFMPTDKPRYLMGVGKPDDIVGAVLRGVDMFDCVIPTRSGRFARGYTFDGEVNIRNAQYTDDAAPIEQGCPCPACTHYSRAYINHLFRADEMLGAMLLTEHNLTFYQRLMGQLREAITQSTLQEYADGFLTRYKSRVVDDEAAG